MCVKCQCVAYAAVCFTFNHDAHTQTRQEWVWNRYTFSAFRNIIAHRLLLICQSADWLTDWLTWKRRISIELRVLREVDTHSYTTTTLCASVESQCEFSSEWLPMAMLYVSNNDDDDVDYDGDGSKSGYGCCYDNCKQHVADCIFFCLLCVVRFNSFHFIVLRQFLEVRTLK